MALQHFYSRVPAKMSMFNKTDGYDTFAHSDGIEREFIEKELSTVYENKPTQENAALIQNGKLPPVYCQFVSGDGNLVQSCITYLQKDYTGERSTYLVHSLIMDAGEMDSLISSSDNLSFNSDMFSHSIDDFELTSFDSKPITDFEVAEYKSVPDADAIDLLNNFDHGMLKRLIYTLINVACGKTKAVYISLHSDIEKFSSDSLNFINSILRIFPYHVRADLPFVTYIGDVTKFNRFKVKCLPENAPVPPVAKGVTLHFSAKDAFGLSDESVAANKSVVDFFFGLIDNDAVRREFLLYCANAVKAMPALAAPSLKNISELVFLFKQCSGLYDEKTVIPDDNTALEFVSVYEKYRFAISDDYRAEALKFLWRYPNAKLAIPKNIFSKLTKIYKNETPASKHTIINIALELIHTDAMRDKLFSFISANYCDEEPKMKTLIMNNLARVYYGGFLQPQLIEFFNTHFANEPEPVCDIIVEKLLLTVRTANVQKLILQFFKDHYGELTASQKDKYYQTFYEMLPECDILSDAMIENVNEHISVEDEDFKINVADKICLLVENDLKHKEPKLLTFLSAKTGFCTNAVIGKVFSEWSGRKVFSEFISSMCKNSPAEFTELLVSIWKTVPEMNADAEERFSSELCEKFADNTSFDLFSLINLESRLKSECDCKQFADKFVNSCLHGMIENKITDAFNSKKFPGGIADFNKYAEENAYIKNSSSYSLIDNYNKMIEAAKTSDGIGMINCTTAFEQKSLRQGVADNLKAELLDTNAISDDSIKLTVLSLVKYLQTGNAVFTDIYLDYSESAADSSSDADRVTVLLKVAEYFYKSKLKDTYFDDYSEIKSCITSYVQKNDKDAKKTIKELLSHYQDADFTNYIQSTVDAVKVKKVGLFEKIFGKK